MFPPSTLSTLIVIAPRTWNTTMWKKRTNEWTAATHLSKLFSFSYSNVARCHDVSFLFSPFLRHTWQQRSNSKSVCFPLSLIGGIDKRAKKYFLTLISAIKTWLRRKTSCCWNEQLPPPLPTSAAQRKHLQSFTHRQMRLLLCVERDMECEEWKIYEISAPFLISRHSRTFKVILQHVSIHTKSVPWS